MCGIAGVAGSFSKTEADQIAQMMVSNMKHRGPDDHGVCTFAADPHVVSLGNTRLSILDPSPAGHQPMTEHSGRYWTVFNGEIYNFQELRRMLDPAERIFRTSSDTEAILEAFSRWSFKSFGMLRGMFAFALYDTEKRLLHLVRDQLGIKPLYYYTESDRIYFASEIRTLLATGNIRARLRPEAVPGFLSCGWVPGPHTMISGVEMLQPGQCLTVDMSRDEIKWEVSAYEEASPCESILLEAERNENVGHLHHLIEQSVKSHMVSDVPVGLFLSGGIDSTAILHFMERVGNSRPQTFTVVFSEEGFSEREYASKVAQRYGAEHREIELNESQLLEEMPAALNAMDQPTMDGVNTFVVAKAVSEAGIKVALSGLGGDELFAGYPSFRRARLAQFAAAVPRPARSALATLGRQVMRGPGFQKSWDLLSSDCTPASVYRISRQLFDEREIPMLAPRGEFLNEALLPTFSEDPINEMSHLEMKGYMTNRLLRESDLMIMASSIEVRVPFVDTVLIRHVLRLSGRWKTRGWLPKPLLLDALRGSIPEYVSHRPKMGFVLPFDRWMRSRFRPQIEETFGNHALAESIGLRPQAVQDVWQGFLKRSVRWSHPWSLFVLLLWCDRYGVSL